MSKTNTTLTRVISFVCALLMLGILATQFLPFWTYGDPAKTVSINGYVWFPAKHTPLGNQLAGVLRSAYNVRVTSSLVPNNLVSTSVVLLVAAALSTLFLIIKSDKKWTALLPFATGIIGIVQYLGNILFQTGMNWQIHLVVCIVAVALAAVNLVRLAIDFFKK